MTDPTADAAKQLPDGLTEEDRPIFEIVARYLRDVTHDVSYPEDRAVEIIQLVRANTRPQPATPEGEPNFAREADMLLPDDFPSSTDPNAPYTRGYRRQNLADEIAVALHHAYHLGLAARPKVEDAEIDHAVKMLRDDVQAYHEIADLLERLAEEVGQYKRAECCHFENVAELRTKLAERDAELAKAEEWVSEAQSCFAELKDVGKSNSRIDWLYVETSKYLNSRHAARQQQKASAEPAARDRE